MKSQKNSSGRSQSQSNSQVNTNTVSGQQYLGHNGKMI